MYKPEPFYVIEPVDYHESALTLRTVGWLLIIVGAMVDGLFVFQGLRDGSYLFAVWACATRAPKWWFTRQANGSTCRTVARTASARLL